LFLADKLTKVLCGQTVPQFTFGVEVLCPKTIQLDSPNPMPLYVRTVPYHDQSSEILDQRSMLVELRAAKISLLGRTTANLQGVVSGTSKRKLLCRDEEVIRTRWTPAEREALWLPSEPEEAALDVGTLVMALRFGEQGSWSVRMGRSGPTYESAVGERVYPDFETYNIRHRHLVKWDLDLRVAMETVRVQGEQLITVLGSAVGSGLAMRMEAATERAEKEKRRSFGWEWLATGGKTDGWAQVPERSQRASV
jgi:hypothetical protein